MVSVSGSLGTAPSTITSARSPWRRRARAKQFASRIAKSLDQKGVIMRLSIRMAQPCCSLTTLNVIIAFHRKWAARNSVPHRTFGTAVIIYSSQRIGGVDLHQMPRWPGSSGKNEESPLTKANRPTLSWSALRIDEHSQVEHAGEIELSSLDPYKDRGSATQGDQS